VGLLALLLAALIAPATAQVDIGVHTLEDELAWHTALWDFFNGSFVHCTYASWFSEHNLQTETNLVNRWLAAFTPSNAVACTPELDAVYGYACAYEVGSLLANAHHNLASKLAAEGGIFDPADEMLLKAQFALDLASFPRHGTTVDEEYDSYFTTSAMLDALITSLEDRARGWVSYTERCTYLTGGAEAPSPWAGQA
jgi:hypothetical protein